MRYLRGPHVGQEQSVHVQSAFVLVDTPASIVDLCRINVHRNCLCLGPMFSAATPIQIFHNSSQAGVKLPSLSGDGVNSGSKKYVLTMEGVLVVSRLGVLSRDQTCWQGSITRQV